MTSPSPNTDKVRYLIAGTGGVGGAIGAFLALRGNDVTFLARGEHLRALQRDGLHLKSDLLGNHTIPVKATTAETCTTPADVIFLCVKSYSIGDIAPQLAKAVTPDTLIIPILNGYGHGRRLAQLLPQAQVLDGCIYIVAFRSAPGEITQMGRIFRLVYGARTEQPVPEQRLLSLAKNLQDAHITPEISPDINRDTFVKWAFISAMACTGAYHNIPMGPIQRKDSIPRQTFTSLSRESAAIAQACGITTATDPVNYNLSIIDSLDPASTASMQKDLAAGHQSEIQSLLFDLVDLGHAHHIPLPTYDRIAAHFAHLRLHP